MKIKRSVLIGSIVVAISILVVTIYLSHIHNQKEQIDIYLTPLIKKQLCSHLLSEMLQIKRALMLKLNWIWKRSSSLHLKIRR